MDRYENMLAAAYVRGQALSDGISLPRNLAEKPLDQLNDQEMNTILRAGESAGLRMYHFKKKDLLPRVRSVLGFLMGIQPESLLDVGSGRGVFLFPFLTAFPHTQVTSVDLLPHRVEMMQSIAQGGVDNLKAIGRDICTWEGDENRFDVVTLLEVLEHIPNVQAAVNNAVRLAKGYVVVTVPSKPDNNPEHIHLLTKDVLTQLFHNAGCDRLHFSGVPGHLVMIASLEQG